MSSWGLKGLRGLRGCQRVPGGVRGLRVLNPSAPQLLSSQAQTPFLHRTAPLKPVNLPAVHPLNIPTPQLPSSPAPQLPSFRLSTLSPSAVSSQFRNRVVFGPAADRLIVDPKGLRAEGQRAEGLRAHSRSQKADDHETGGLGTKEQGEGATGHRGYNSEDQLIAISNRLFGQPKTTSAEIKTLSSQTWSVIRETIRGGKAPSQDSDTDKAGEKSGPSLRDPDTAQVIRRLISLVGPEKRVILLAVGTIVLTTPISLFFPAAVGKLLDVSTAANATISPVTISAALLFVFTVQGALMAFRDALLSVSGERVAARLRSILFATVMRQDMAFFDQSRTGELVNRLASDTLVVQKALTNNITSALRSVGMVIGGTGMLVFTSPKLAFMSLLVIPPGGAIAVFFGRFMKRKQKEVQDTLAETAQKAEEVISNMRAIRQFTREEIEVREYKVAMEHSRNLAISVGIANSLLGSAIHVAANVSLATVLGYGGLLVIAGEMTTGQLTSFLLYSVYVGFNFGNLSTIYGDMMKAVGASQRLFAIIDREPSLPPYDYAKAGATLPGFKGNVEFKDLTFGYPSRPDIRILNGFSLEVKAGQVIGIVGASGSGKSTVGALLTRLYDPDAGSVKFDGVEIKDLDSLWVRSVVGAVPQEPALFAGTIADNIRYGNPEATIEEVKEAARIANAHEFTERFPDGYETNVGERGVQLSGGQKQRIAIARAILKNPPVLLLDEATSALDSASEGLVQQALERVSKGRTVIKIAHRLNTVRDADLIAVVVHGQVVETGKMDELLAKKGAFYDLVRSQSMDAGAEELGAEGTEEPRV